MYPDEIGEPLTPSHLISGRRMLSLPDTTKRGADNPSSSQETVSRRARYLQTLMDHFWNLWRREYVPALRESHRLKEVSPGPVVQKGDVVSIHDESLPQPECESRAEDSAGDDQRVKETVKKPIQAAQGESQSRPRRLAALEGEQRRRLLTNACVVIG